MSMHTHTAKIVITGGGSPSCVSLLDNIVRHADSLQGCHIVITDTDEEGLDLCFRLGQKLFQNAGIALSLEQTASREEAISDATFVLTTFRTGGLRARYKDEKLPLRHSLIGHHSLGAGGFFYALRTIPEAVGIAAEVEKLAPKAFLLNYTSPSNIVTEAITHASGIRVIGMSDGPTHEIRRIAQEAQISLPPQAMITHRTVGLNHGNWTTALWHEGQDILPEIISWCEQALQQNVEMTANNYEYQMFIALAAHYKAIPSHYMHYYYFPERVLQFLQRRPATPAEVMMAQRGPLLAHLREEASKEAPHLTKTQEGAAFGEIALRVLTAILNNRGEEWVLNVPNRGAIDFLPAERIVKVPCYVDARGATPLIQGDGGITAEQRGLLALLAEYEGLTAKVALWGNKHDAIKALAASPLVMSYSKAEEVYHDLANEHAQYLPARLLH